MLVQFPALAENVSFLQSVQTGCVRTQPPAQCVQELLHGDKRQGHESDHLRPSSAEVENECSYAFTPSYSLGVIPVMFNIIQVRSKVFISQNTTSIILTYLLHGAESFLRS